jgi:hypothetical protein
LTLSFSICSELLSVLVFLRKLCAIWGSKLRIAKKIKASPVWTELSRVLSFLQWKF